jgi:hypothetical protein
MGQYVKVTLTYWPIGTFVGGGDGEGAIRTAGRQDRR